MSPQEMTLDPTFGWNRDLPEYSNIRYVRYVKSSVVDLISMVQSSRRKVAFAFAPEVTWNQT